MTVANSSITVPEAGTYLVSFGFGKASVDGETNNVAIAINGTTNTNTQRATESEASNSGTFVLTLSANDVITLVPTVAAETTLSSTAGPSVYLTVVRIF